MLSLNVGATTYYVATNGNNSFTGTINSPWASWQYGIGRLTPGDNLYIRGGTYTPFSINHSGTYCGVYLSGVSGTVTDSIKVMAYPGETPILSGVNITEAGLHFGIWIQYCNYWAFKGLRVTQVREYNNGANYSGSWQFNDCYHIFFDRDVADHSGEGFDIFNSDYIWYKNCDAYHNADLINQGDYSNGFGGNCNGGHIQHTGCRAWGNSDDGYDYATSDYYPQGGYISWKNCWSMYNGSGARGNGVGFKIGMVVGTKQPGVQRRLISCLAFWNKSLGFDESGEYTTIAITLLNNTSHHNNSDGYSFNYSSTSAKDTIRNCISFQDQYNGTIAAGNIEDHNAGDKGRFFQELPITSSAFLSLDTTGATGPRSPGGSLPVLNYLKPAPGSVFIDAGAMVGEKYNGNAPDIGAYESVVVIPPVNLASVTTTSVTKITSTTGSASITAQSGGNVTNDGGGTVTARGVCWSTSHNPTITDSKTTNGTGKGAFTSNVTGLSIATYYIRAYATNSAGTAYGQELSFTVNNYMIIQL